MKSLFPFLILFLFFGCDTSRDTSENSQGKAIPASPSSTSQGKADENASYDPNSDSGSGGSGDAVDVASKDSSSEETVDPKPSDPGSGDDKDNKGAESVDKEDAEVFRTTAESEEPESNATVLGFPFPETVLVGNPGNPSDASGFGSVSYAYRIGKYEVTNSEYCEFLNAVAKRDRFRLYDSRMAGEHGGIGRSGISGNYTYETKDDAAKKPVSYVTWESCARYANWLSNRSGDSDLQDGPYQLKGGVQPKVALPDHVALAAGKKTQWVVAGEDEWYKAAYYDPDKPGGGGYWPFAVRGGSAPNCNINSNRISVVGAFKSASPYGTYDQNGNLWEYNETRKGNKVGLRGGSFFINDHEGYLRSNTRYDVLSAKWPNYGFRVVALGGNLNSISNAEKPKANEESGETLSRVNDSPSDPPEEIVVPVPARKGDESPKGGRVFYVSSSEGDDGGDGTSPSAKGPDGPWKTLARASVEYLPGDRILLKRGDSWNEEFRPKGSGTPDKPIAIEAYGKGSKPLIDRLDYNKDLTGIRLSDQAGFRIVGIEFARCMTGIYADYSDNAEERKFLWIEDCYFRDSLKYQHYEDYPKRKIGLGVCLFSYERDNRVVLSDITVKNCVFRRLASGFWTNSPDNFNKNASYVYNFRNLVFEDCLFEEGFQWQQGIRGVDTGAMRNCVTHDVGRKFRSFNGVAGSMFFRCKNWVFENCEWGFISIGLGSGDGQAFDFEGNCDNMIMRNCLFHDTDGPGFLLCCYASDGHPHTKILMENCVINGKSKRPIGLPRCAIVNTTDWNESTWRKCRFYLSKGEAVMRVMDPEKDKRTTFVDCRVKDLASACSSPKLWGNVTQSGKESDQYWIQLNFGKPTTVNELRIREKESSKVFRYVIEAWDSRNSSWKSCFNGRFIGAGFVAPIVERRTTKVRLRVIGSEHGKPAIDEFAAFNDPVGEEWNVTRGESAPARVGRGLDEIQTLARLRESNSDKSKKIESLERIMAWDVEKLFEKPVLHETEERPAKGMRSFFFEGAEYKGKPTKVFAYYALPKGDGPKGGWPAVVCAHGGGGTAYPEWVKFWNNNGFGAIAMDLEGHFPGGKSHHVEGNFPVGVGHPDAGPSRVDWFGDRDLPDKEQWFYHALADVVRANSLLRSFKEINPGKIGLHGISWGGTIAAAAAGVDSRFAFVVPVYGGGFIHESDNEGLAQWFPPKNMTDAQYKDYRSKWDPSVHLPFAKMPMLWVTSVADPVFQINIFSKSARSTAGESRLCLRPWMIHAHGSGWSDAPEIVQFANSVVNDGPSLPRLSTPDVDPKSRHVSTPLEGKEKITEAWIYYTTSEGKWKNRKWHFIRCAIRDEQLVSQKALPRATKAFYVYVFRDKGGYRDNHVATELVELD